MLRRHQLPWLLLSAVLQHLSLPAGNLPPGTSRKTLISPSCWAPPAGINAHQLRIWAVQGIQDAAHVS